jgi:hypothetical protein
MILATKRQRWPGIGTIGYEAGGGAKLVARTPGLSAPGCSVVPEGIEWCRHDDDDDRWGANKT